MVHRSKNNADVAFYEKTLSGTIKDTLRQQLQAAILSDSPRADTCSYSAPPASRLSAKEPSSQSASPKPDIQQLANIQTQTLVNYILSNPYSPQKMSAYLEDLYNSYFAIYTRANIPKPLRTRRYISATGLVISPDHCTHSIKDGKRVYAFIRGVDAAIKALRKKQKDTLRIAYPACGPFAPLLLPLINHYRQSGIFSAKQLQITLLDIQQGATRSLKHLISQLDIAEYFENVICCNACDYKSSAPFDIVVLEALQHGFSREGHLKIAQHFAQQLKCDGVMLPERIYVGAAITNAQQEYVEQWQNHSLAENPEITVERIELGEILRVDLPMLRQMNTLQHDESTQLYPCQTVSIPNDMGNMCKQVLIIHTRIHVYGSLYITEYESGITHPLPDLQVCINFVPKDQRPGDLIVQSGDTVQFFYCMNGLPGFLPINLGKRQRTASNAPTAKKQQRATVYD